MAPTGAQQVGLPAAVLAVLMAAGLLAVEPASTAGNVVPPSSTVVHRGTTVVGATLASLDYTMTAGKITGVLPRLRDTDLLTSTVTARFGSGPPVLCTAGQLTVVNVATGLGEATFTCAGFAERADRPRALTITA